MTSTEKRLGLLFTLVGPGGVGKNALINMVLDQVDNLRQLPTATTRPIRPTEQQGREHLFVTRDGFQKMIDDDELLEWQEVHAGRFYGVPRRSVEDAIAANENLIADIEIYGATILRNRYPDNVILIFIAPPSLNALLTRMQERGDSQVEIDKRLQRATLEMPYAPACDYMIVNDDMEAAAETLKAIILAERSRSVLANHRVNNQLPRHRLMYSAAVIVLYNGEILHTQDESGILRSRLYSGELPHEAALRLVGDHLPITPIADNLWNSMSGAASFVAPISVECLAHAYFEEILFTYIYVPNERVEAPKDWNWISIEDEQISEEVARALRRAGVQDASAPMFRSEARLHDPT